MRKTTVSAVALAAAAALALSACDGGDDAKPAVDTSATASQRASTTLDQPFDKPHLVLTDTRGKSYDLVKETKGHPTLVYFGYTHCPDVCPLTMSNIDIALRKLTKAEQRELRVVFITTDPERDTPKELGSWLAAQNRSFVGLTGDFGTIQAGARRLGIFLDKPKKQKDGTWSSTHSTQVLAFSPKDDKAHVLYNKDATAEEYARDLPKIIKGRTP